MRIVKAAIAVLAPTAAVSAFFAFSAAMPAVQAPPSAPRAVVPVLPLVLVPPPPVTVPAEPVTTSLLAVGDVMLSRNVGNTMLRKGYDYPYEFVRDLVSGADVAFANLETSVTPGKPVLTNGMSFRADPASVTAMAAAGFDVVSLANNHTPNYGQKGLADTFAYLDAAGIRYAGAGPDEAGARKPALFEHDGVRFALLAYNDADVVPDAYFAADGHAGTAKMDLDHLREDVAAAKAAADVVLVSMHSGHEYVVEPNARQTAFARAAIDAGAEAVIGHHAHWVQRAEWYKGKLVLYGLGNFVFDQMWSQATREGLAVRLTFRDASLSGAELFPMLIEDYAQPRPADAATSKRVLGRLGLPVETDADGIARLSIPE